MVRTVDSNITQTALENALQRQWDVGKGQDVQGLFRRTIQSLRGATDRFERALQHTTSNTSQTLAAPQKSLLHPQMLQQVTQKLESSLQQVNQKLQAPELGEPIRSLSRMLHTTTGRSGLQKASPSLSANPASVKQSVAMAQTPTSTARAQTPRSYGISGRTQSSRGRSGRSTNASELDRLQKDLASAASPSKRRPLGYGGYADHARQSRYKTNPHLRAAADYNISGRQDVGRFKNAVSKLKNAKVGSANSKSTGPKLNLSSKEVQMIQNSPDPKKEVLKVLAKRAGLKENALAGLNIKDKNGMRNGVYRTALNKLMGLEGSRKAIRGGSEKNSASALALDTMATKIAETIKSKKTAQPQTSQRASQPTRQAPSRQAGGRPSSSKRSRRRPAGFVEGQSGFSTPSVSNPTGNNSNVGNSNVGTEIRPEEENKSFAQMASEISFSKSKKRTGKNQNYTGPGEEIRFDDPNGHGPPENIDFPDSRWPPENFDNPDSRWPPENFNNPDSPWPPEGLRFPNRNQPGRPNRRTNGPNPNNPPPPPPSSMSLDLSPFGGALGDIASLASPLIFDLEGTGLQLSKDAKMIAVDIDGDGKYEMITDLDAELGLLIFDSTGQGIGELTGEDMFGDNTDLSHYGITADTHDGNFKDGFDALRALCEHMKLVDDTKQFLDASDLALLEEKIGLRMRVGGLINGGQRQLHEVGISQINLGNPNQTQHLEDAASDRWGNKIILQDGATFVVHDITRKYADIWFRVQARVKEETQPSNTSKQTSLSNQ